MKISDKEFIKEHKRLPKVLMDGNKTQRRKEAIEQKGELEDFLEKKINKNAHGKK